ncbi:MAG: CAP domain-containing protein [Bacteroidetes bacterium]|nr:CAP domain-containing protein [Bacteroidota bacterium]
MRMTILFSLIALFSCQTTNIADVEPVSDSFKQEMLYLVNEVRSQGCTCGGTFFPAVAPLDWDHQLEMAAGRHAADMDVNGFFSHKGSDGTRVAQRATEAGYVWSSIGENIAFGYQSVEMAVQAWIDSPSHCELMMSPDFIDMGAARSGTYWVQTFGRTLD